MRVNAKVIPDSIARLMRPADRKAAGVLTPEERTAKADAGLERELQAKCEGWLARHGIAYLHLSPRAREKAGWPDLVFARSTGGSRPATIAYAVELKSARGRLRDGQKAMLEEMARNGWTTAVVRSYEGFVELVTTNRRTDDERADTDG